MCVHVTTYSHNTHHIHTHTNSLHTHTNLSKPVQYFVTQLPALIFPGDIGTPADENAHLYECIYIYICVCVCVCVRV
jgi:hypothetical protein